jgi:hypothetical protein
LKRRPGQGLPRPASGWQWVGGFAPRRAEFIARLGAFVTQSLLKSGKTA